MHKRDLYFHALNEGAHLRKAWVLKAFSVTRERPGVQVQPWDIRYNRESTEAYVRQPDNSFAWEQVTETQAGMEVVVPPLQPVFIASEPIKLQAGEVPNLKRNVDSTYGDVLFNWRVLVYAFGDLLDYVVGPVNIKGIEKEIVTRMVNNPKRGEQEDDSQLYVYKYLRYGQSIADLAGFTQLWVPAATAKSLQTDPAIRQRRAELLEKHKDRLHDPAVVAEIQNELIKMDRDWIKGDASEGFFLGDKVYNTARKRMFLIHGPEAGFDEGGNAELVVNSLDEGWDISKMPAMVNSLRAGSYYRGALTALGGESVKFFLRVFQNTYISQQDCGVKFGKIVELEKDTAGDLEGMYQITGGSIRKLTPELLKSLIGQKIMVRSPQYCQTPHSDFCATCMGDKNSENPNGLGSAASDVGSLFMSIMMASAHAKELKTAPLRVDTFLT